MANDALTEARPSSARGAEPSPSAPAPGDRGGWAGGRRGLGRARRGATRDAATPRNPPSGMVEDRRLWIWLAHAVLILGALVMLFPVWMAFVASTHTTPVILGPGTPLTPGDAGWDNYAKALSQGGGGSRAPASVMLLNSLLMALGIALGKIAISLLSAFAVVFFRFPFRMFAFWMIFLTLMLPVEVRIFPTVEVVSTLGLRNTYAGLILPLIASATATFLFRQFFLTIPDSYVEAARMDGAGPWTFFTKILLPLSRTNIAALFVILFIYGWNQYLLPLIVADKPQWYTVVMGVKRQISSDADPDWAIIMATAILALVPPVIVVLAMQRLFVRGLVENDR